MLKNVKQLIDSRLGRGIALDELMVNNTHFIKLKTSELARAARFLRQDPDTSLTLFHQMLYIPSDILPWQQSIEPDATGNLLYEFKSLKLPYEVTLVIATKDQDEAIPSLTHLYPGAHFCEADIAKKTGLQFESSSAQNYFSRGHSPW